MRRTGLLAKRPPPHLSTVIPPPPKEPNHTSPVSEEEVARTIRFFLCFGASPIELWKKGGGVRPSAVGQTLRRLATKCFGARVLQPIMGSYLAPLELGYGSPSGAEVAAHAAQLYLDHTQSDHPPSEVKLQKCI